MRCWCVQDEDEAEEELQRYSNSEESASHEPQRLNGRSSRSSQVPSSGLLHIPVTGMACSSRLSAPGPVSPERAMWHGRAVRKSLSCRSPVQSLPPGVNRVGRMEIGPEILGYGSSGTLVFEGTLDGRPIAVKRILCQVATPSMPHASIGCSFMAST